MFFVSKGNLLDFYCFSLGQINPGPATPGYTLPLQTL